MPRTKVTTPQLSLSKTVDANGWTVYDYGAWKEYRKRVTFTFNLSAGGIQSIALSSNSLPSGMSTIGTNFISATAALNGNAYAMGWNFEMVSGANTVNITVINNAGGTVNNTGWFDVTITSP